MQNYYSGYEYEAVDTAVRDFADSPSPREFPPLRINHPEILAWALNPGIRLTLSADKVLTFLGCFVDEYGECEVNHETICHYTGLGVSAVKNGITELELTELALKVPQHNGVTRENNRYVLLGRASNWEPKAVPAEAPKPLLKRAVDIVRAAREERDYWKARAMQGTASPDDPAEAEPTSTYSHEVTIGREAPENPHAETDALFDQWYDRGLSKRSSPSGKGWELRTKARNHYRRNPAELRQQVADIQADLEVIEAKARAEEDSREAQGRERESREAIVPRRPTEGADAQAEMCWRAVLGELELQLPRPTFEVWLKPTSGYAMDE